MANEKKKQTAIAMTTLTVTESCEWLRNELRGNAKICSNVPSYTTMRRCYVRRFRFNLRLVSVATELFLAIIRPIYLLILGLLITLNIFTIKLIILYFNIILLLWSTFTIFHLKFLRLLLILYIQAYILLLTYH